MADRVDELAVAVDRLADAAFGCRRTRGVVDGPGADDDAMETTPRDGAVGRAGRLGTVPHTLPAGGDLAGPDTPVDVE
ncbi:hypothetical protein BRD17_08775 [Halobacteriales archaeon SW_7_68_16]|nr:MAG: hypothetical protein BRD17_08775 [Halobacteriales archaeon SW_7_68_16]